MKIAIHRKSLLDVINLITRIVPSSKIIPILNYVRVDVVDNLASFTATDNSVSITVGSISVASSENGSFLLPAADVQSCLNLARSDGVVLVYEENRIRLVSGNTWWVWPVLDVSQFVKISSWHEAIVHILPKSDFLSALRLVKPAASDKSFNSNLEQIGIRQGWIQAGDGIRFHRVLLGNSELLDIALPIPFVSTLFSVLPKVDSSELKIAVPESGESVMVRCDNITLMTRTRTERFPDLLSTFKVPELSNHIELKVPREALRAAVRRVRITADNDTRSVHLRLSGDDFSTMEVSAQQRSGSSSSERLSVDWAGGDRVLVLHAEYLLSLLGMFTSEFVVIRLGIDAKHKPSPILIMDGTCSGVLQQLRLIG